jgi:chemotaxis protein methyltransferase CheR
VGELLILKHDLEKEFAYRRSDFEAVRHKLKLKAGISLADSKDSMVYSRLARRIRALKLNSFEAYLKVVDSSKVEEEFFINALTTNLTSFFRESHHFDVLKRFIEANPEPLKIWCAACSTGEEAYSIAITCAEARGSLNHNISIVASDIDSNVLSIAKKGVYRSKSVESLSKKHKKAYLLKGTGKNSGMVKVSSKLGENISFFKQNLLDKDWLAGKGVDVVFCRNVMIYFDKPTQDELIKRFVKIMTPGALYIAGHSENFAHLPKELKPLGQTVYQLKGHRRHD